MTNDRCIYHIWLSAAVVTFTPHHTEAGYVCLIGLRLSYSFSFFTFSLSGSDISKCGESTAARIAYEMYRAET
jgi:hypothetical protein